jgi:hypothetical protein
LKYFFGAVPGWRDSMRQGESPSDMRKVGTISWLLAE